jgi:hypothetical protein
LYAIHFLIRISLAHKTPSFDAKVLQKVVFDKTSFVKFKISNNFQQNIDETYSKQRKSIGKYIPAFGFEKSQKINRKPGLQTFAKCL